MRKLIFAVALSLAVVGGGAILLSAADVTRACSIVEATSACDGGGW